MSYLLRTKEDYRLCYGEPKELYIVTDNGSYFCATEYQKIINEEKEVECWALMDANNFTLDGWADVCQNNKGLFLADNIAEYLLDGDHLDCDTFVEITAAMSF
tara:strand:- start:137 stop:445 length:309 start_codon:yes stop_codon:yes gene_type:complete